MPTIEEAYAQLVSENFVVAKCFPNTCKPLAAEIQADDFVSEDEEEGWSNFNVAIKATKNLSALVFPSSAKMAEYGTAFGVAQKDLAAMPQVMYPNGNVAVLFRNPDWVPHDVRFEKEGWRNSTLVNVGYILMPPSVVGNEDIVEGSTPIRRSTIQNWAVATELRETSRRLAKPYRYGSDIIPISGLLSFALPRRQPYMGGGLLDANSKAVLAGEPKIGKSRLAAYWAFCLATKTSFLDVPVERVARTLYVQFEVDESRFQERIWELGVHGFNLSASSTIPLFIKSVGHLSLDSDEGLYAVADFVRECNPDVVFLDPLYKIHSGEENSNSEMQSRLYDKLDQIIDEHKLTLIITHHVNKNTGDKGWTRIRGAGQLAAWVDTIMTVDRVGPHNPAVEVNALLRNGEGFVKTIEFGDHHTVMTKSDTTAIELHVTETIKTDPGITRKKLTAEVAREFHITQGEVATLLRRMEDKGYMLPL